MTEPNGSTVTYVYDADGEVIDTTDEDGRRTTYSYDADGDTTGETWLTSSGGALHVITYTYDADNDLSGATDSNATLTFTYDANGDLLTDATSGPGAGQPSVLLSYTYDPSGSETSVTDNLGSQGITTFTYDLDERVTQVATTYGGSAGPQVNYTYTPDSQISSESRTIGGGGTSVNTSFSYDAADRETTITHQAVSFTSGGGGGETTTPLATFVYGYDQANRVTSEVDAEGTYTFTYDNANELIGASLNGAQTNSYSYDLNGNQTGTGYTTTTGNEQTASPGYAYTYDNAGNMISAKNTSTSVITTYTYDYRNRLTEVTTGGTIVATYTYDALNDRIGIDDSGTQTWTVYDGTNPYADFSGSGTLEERYQSGPGMVDGSVVDELLARTSASGATAWYLTDKLGSVHDIVSSSGTELDHIVYDSFGNIVTETNATNGDRFKFAGMEYDAVIGQYFDRARWYGSGTGRFDSQDPTGFSAGDPNLRRYVGNGPTDATDTTGEVEDPPTQSKSQTPNPTGVGQGRTYSMETQADLAKGTVSMEVKPSQGTYNLIPTKPPTSQSTGEKIENGTYGTIPQGYPPPRSQGQNGSPSPDYYKFTPSKGWQLVVTTPSSGIPLTKSKQIVVGYSMQSSNGETYSMYYNPNGIGPLPVGVGSQRKEFVPVPGLGAQYISGSKYPPILNGRPIPAAPYSKVRRSTPPTSTPQSHSR